MSDANARLAALRAKRSAAPTGTARSSGTAVADADPTAVDRAAAVPAASDPTKVWHKTACVLCSNNCGIEVRLDGRRITRVRGDKDHPASKGYTCEKALRIDYYQNGRDQPHDAAAPQRRRHVRGDQLGRCDRRGRRAPDRHPRLSRRRQDPLLRRRRPGQSLSRCLRPRRTADTGRQVPVERAGPGKDRHVLGARKDVRPSEPRRHGRFRTHRLRGVHRQEPLAEPRLPRVAQRVEQDPQRRRRASSS